ncbi:PREDICTED: probable RNA-binding protein EIF1AD [Drosophila arizonae]|uniref:Probable RNA-binding protein EIF1AD n=1 Tax=Drosophila arizonae TaxID=7263 RepID=A0ABM1NXE0_DROAR|nr:PREDICTED: probable RNA-binding protein EIF1AD [Drosophila arizonae]
MSHPNTTRRKHVLKEMMEDDYSLPTEQQQIVRVVSSRGNNLHEVESATAENFLVSMPNKFRKNVWVKRGDYILVEPIEEGDKVKAEINKILTPEHIKEFTKAGIWPELFAKKPATPSSKAEHSGASGSDSDDSLPPNTNRPANMDDDDEDTEESSAED